MIGGAERVLFEQSTRLAKRGHNVHILTRRLEDHAKNQDALQGVTEWRYAVDLKNPAFFLKNTWMNAKQLFEELHQRFNYDCINFHQPFTASGILRSPLSRLIPRIYTCHSLSFEEYISRNHLPDKIVCRIIRWLNILIRKQLEGSALRKSDKIFVLSKFTSRKLKDIYNIPPTKVSLLPGGVDLDIYSPAVDQAKIRRILDIPVDKVILFTVRNLVPRMGLEILLDAYAKVAKTVPDMYLVIGGEGPLQKELSTLAKTLGIAGFIKFAGYIPEKQLPDFYRMADLFILPTKELEGFGLVTLEALATGLPVLGTPVGGTKEILGYLDSKFLFADTSSDSMADLILKNYHIITAHPQKWRDIRQKCRLFAEKHYCWEKNVDSLEELFFKLSGRQKQAGSIVAGPSG
jgi:glycosyltransferase involved in cell wall biosynthesis